MDTFNEKTISDQQMEAVNGGTAHTVHPFVEKKKCIKCRQCQAACMQGAIMVVPTGVNVKIGLCNGCGDCANVCPAGAITMVG